MEISLKDKLNCSFDSLSITNLRFWVPRRTVFWVPHMHWPSQNWSWGVKSAKWSKLRGL